MKKIIILPVLNESETIPAVVGKIIQTIPDIDILFIDDNSKDGSKEILQELEKNSENIKVLHRPERLGLASAYIMGFKYAINHGYEIVTQMDSDLSHDPACLAEFYSKIKDCDFVVGSRYVDGGKVVNWNAFRRAISKAGNLYARTILGKGISDYTGGYNTWRTDVLKRIDPDQLRSQGYSFLIELKYKAICQGYSCIEIPIIFSERKAGKSKMGSRIILEAIWRVWSFKIRR
ncbi:MAG: polyprenol monophosphomannose synthase [Candidatus Aureabacteria bacterium]|nr:polyprenol monophosphomannose synthase [Candidatus Auribacterota bacterium]